MTDNIAGASASPRRPRSVQIDAVRGVAVFGILLVNIWSFVWGVSALRYGVMPAPFLADRAAVFMVALLTEQKCYPIFAFLFGAGFALQTKALRKRLPDWRSVRLAYRGRLIWLLGWGLLHGVLIWAGDILTVYGLTGFLLLGMAGARLSRIRVALWCWTAAWVLLVAINVAGALAPSNDSPDQQNQQNQQEAIDHIDDALAAHAVYLSGSADEVLAQRIADYAAVTTGSVMLVPQLMVLFLLGILAVRLGWLTRPGRHPVLWRRVRTAGLCLGIPFNLLWASVALAEAVNPLAAPAYGDLVFALLPVGGPVLAAAWLAFVMLARGVVRQMLDRWIAPVGRMSLTNYLSQSLLCVLLLQGAGLGLSAVAVRRPALLIVIAAAIMLFQVLLSRWWLSRHAQGPVEALYVQRV